MERIKVIQFIHGLSMGGAETLVKEYALKIDKNKFEVIILCFSHYNNSPYEEQLKNDGIKILCIQDFQKFYNKNGFLYKVFNHFQRYVLVKKIIRYEQPNILHTHLPINRFVKYAAPKKNTRIIHTVHSEPKRYWPNKKNRDYKAALYLVKKYNMKFICLHEKMRTEVNDIFNVKDSIVLNNGIDINKFNDIEAKDIMKKKLKIPLDSFVIGHIGRFNKVKNHEFIVDIFNELHKKNSKAFLLMIGTGEEMNNIINKLDKFNLNNHYLILENRSDIPDLLNIMDLFVFPSLKEGIPLSLIEAQEAKLPCFISDGVSEAAIISNIVTVISLNKTDKEWANTMLNYRIPRIVKIYDDNWDMNKIVKKLEHLYADKKAERINK